jgi:hypothetical protein
MIECGLDGSANAVCGIIGCRKESLCAGRSEAVEKRAREEVGRDVSDQWQTAEREIAPVSTRDKKKGMWHGFVQLTNWDARIVASTIPEFGKRVVVVLVTYPNDQCELLELSVNEFRSLIWIDSLHVDAITYVTDDALRRRIVEAIQVKGVPELMDDETFDRVYEQLADELTEQQRLRVDIC